MEIINITCLRQKSQRHRPKWVGKLPESWAEKWQLKHCPWVETAEAAGCYCLQTNGEGCFLQPWREKAAELLRQAADQGAKIALSPLAADLPQGILPFATGKKLCLLFGAEAAATALESLGKCPEGVSFVVADGGSWETEAVLAALPSWVNRLGILTDRQPFFASWQERFLEERGLVVEVFSSVGYGVFREADVVLSCAKGNGAMAYALAEGAVLLDLVGNGTVTENIALRRPDVLAADGFFFGTQKEMEAGDLTEARAYCENEMFQAYFDAPGAEKAAEAKVQLGQLCPVGFLLGGKRRKIVKKPG